MFSQEAISKWNGFVNDWNKFAYDYLRIRLDNEQQEVLYSVQVNPKTAVASGTSRGKDYVAAAAGICFLYLTPRWDEKGNLIANTKVIMTAPTDRQVGKIMIPEITRIFQNSIYLPGELVGYDIRLPNKEWYLTGFKADDTKMESWTGYHAVNILFIATEATGLADPIFGAIEGNLQGNSRLLIVANPNIPTGYFAQAMRNPSFKKFRLNSLHATNVVEKRIVIPGQVDYDWIKQAITDWCKVIRPEEKTDIDADFFWEGQWFRPNDIFRAKVLGRFPRVSTDVLVPQEWIEVANKRWKEAQADAIMDRSGNKGSTAQVEMMTKPLRLGVDVAGMGRDASAFVYRHGRYVEKIEKFHGSGGANHMEITGNVVIILRNKTNTFNGQYAQSFIDTIGEGAGSYSRLLEINEEAPTKKELPIHAHSVKSSQAAEWEGRALTDATGQYKFLNMRAYLYWAVRDWLNPDNKTEAMLPEDPELEQELTETKWKFRSDGKIQIEGKDELKKRIKRSPDKADALANTFYPEPDIDPRPGKKHTAQEAANFFF